MLILCFILDVVSIEFYCVKEHILIKNDKNQHELREGLLNADR